MSRIPKAASYIAAHLGRDEEEINDYRYQPTRTTAPVFAIGNDYWCAGKKPAEHFDDRAWKWQRVISRYDRKTVLWHFSADD